MPGPTIAMKTSVSQAGLSILLNTTLTTLGKNFLGGKTARPFQQCTESANLIVGSHTAVGCCPSPKTDRPVSARCIRLERDRPNVFV